MKSGSEFGRPPVATIPKCIVRFLSSLSLDRAVLWLSISYPIGLIGGDLLGGRHFLRNSFTEKTRAGKEPAPKEGNYP
jgi:hypothetical protein